MEPQIIRYTDGYGKYESVPEAERLTADELREIIAREGYTLVRHVEEDDGSEGCGQIVLKGEDLHEIGAA
jgi:hypothetical protein